MFKRIFILCLPVCFVLDLGFSLAAPPGPSIQIRVPPRQFIDLDIVDMRLDDNCYLCADFANKGNGSINKDIKGEVYIDGSFFLYILILNPSLGPGQTYNWKGGAQFKITGSHAVKIIIDSDNQLAEADETNNMMTKSLYCPLKPDLIVDKIEYREEGNGHWLYVSITVKNVGNLEAASSKVKLEKAVPASSFNFISACGICERPFPALDPGESSKQEIPFPFDLISHNPPLPPAPIPYRFRATADSNNNVSESNEGNNSKIDFYAK